MGKKNSDDGSGLCSSFVLLVPEDITASASEDGSAVNRAVKDHEFGISTAIRGNNMERGSQVSISAADTSSLASKVDKSNQFNLNP